MDETWCRLWSWQWSSRRRLSKTPSSCSSSLSQGCPQDYCRFDVILWFRILGLNLKWVKIKIKWLPVIFGNNLEVVPRIFTLLRKWFKENAAPNWNQNLEERWCDLLHPGQRGSHLFKVCSWGSCDRPDLWRSIYFNIKLRRKVPCWLKIGCVFDLAIQVAGSGEALKDREGEMVEKRVLVDGVFHFRNLGGTKPLNLHLQEFQGYLSEVVNIETLCRGTV